MIKKSITGSTVPHLTQNMLVNFPIPIPSVSEQRSIVKQLDEKLKFQNDDLFITKRYFSGCTKILETQQGKLED